MILLAVDTSGKEGSIALARVPEDARDSSELTILEMIPLEGGTFSAQLVPQIASLLAKHGLSKNDIAAFAVASGPGSFTGLRVGLAAIKALAEVLQKPIIAMSRMEAMAHDLLMDGRAATDDLCSPIPEFAIALDASRKEVFLAEGEFDTASILPKAFNESLVTLVELAEAANHWGRGRFIYTPDIEVWEFLKANVRDPFLFNAYLRPRPTAGSIVRLGMLKLVRGLTVSPEELEANYIRRSDAELFARSQS